MTCQDFERLVSDLARKQMIEVGLRQEATTHTNGCRTCALKLDDQLTLSVALQTLATEMKSIKTPDRVEQQLLASFREQVATSQRPHQVHGWRYAVTAVAAALLLVFGLVAMQSRRPATAPIVANPEKVAVVENSPNALSLSGTTVKPLFKPTTSKRTTVRRVLKPRGKNLAATVTSVKEPAAAPAAHSIEVTSGFMPLGYVTASNLQDGGQLVRVEMSRAAMASLGIPVNMDRYGERVKADVLLGVDGLARAIRFVQ